jgi:hypothetical protein
MAITQPSYPVETNELVTHVGAYTDTEVSTHTADTTSVHGITDTSALATSSDVSGAVSTHNSDETAVHGIVNTALLVGFNVFNVTWPARPDFGIVLWIGGDASDDDPSADMDPGDVWYPESE